MKYKGYATKIEYSEQDKVFVGKIQGINDLVSFNAYNVDEVEVAFKEAVDDYLEMCKEIGKKPEKEYSGQFNIRISADLHKKIALKAIGDGSNINSIVTAALEKYMKAENATTNITINLQNITKSSDECLKQPIQKTKRYINSKDTFKIVATQ